MIRGYTKVNMSDQLKGTISHQEESKDSFDFEIVNMGGSTKQDTSIASLLIEETFETRKLGFFSRKGT
jgi:hypothetical protein